MHALRLTNLRDLQVVARIGSNGPILKNITFRMMRLRTTAQTAVFVGGKIDNTTHDIHMPVVVDGLYSGTKIDFKIFIGGVTFEDGTLVKSLTMPNDVDANGQALLHFYKTGDLGASCHRIEILQGDEIIANY